MVISKTDRVELRNGSFYASLCSVICTATTPWKIPSFRLHSWLSDLLFKQRHERKSKIS